MVNRRHAVVLTLVSLAGCATPPSVTPIAAGESVGIDLITTAAAPGSVDFRNLAVGEGVSAGVGSGAVVGGLWGLGCGPFAVLCVPLGAIAGMVTGGVAGAAVGVTGALPADKQSRVQQRLAQIEQAQPLSAALRRQLDERARRQWVLDAAAPATRLTLELLRLQVDTTRDERLRFVVRVRVTIQRAGVGRDARPDQGVYEYLSPLASLAVWLDEQADFLATSHAGAAQQIAAQLVADLTARR